MFSSKEYANYKNKTGHHICPFCNAKNGKLNNGKENIHCFNIIEGLYECSQCLSRWKETYELTGYVKIKGGLV